VGAKAKETDECKLWYSSFKRAANRVDILVKKDLVEQVVEGKHESDRIMSIKLAVGLGIFNVISVYAPQIGLDENIKRLFL